MKRGVVEHAPAIAPALARAAAAAFAVAHVGGRVGGRVALHVALDLALHVALLVDGLVVRVDVVEAETLRTRHAAVCGSGGAGDAGHPRRC
eukprot:4684810-Pleurochrysis_carterae.AAC.1